ncbi:hypothetical protein V1264_009454 [Littorina saxatilis]|uniref:Claudin n=1 Tax=Littorina saxatilis TaxID=31220 RepID=A0AAN9G1E5_9CAEN
MGFTISTLMGLVCAGVGLIVQIVGVTTPGWVVVGAVRSGLWKQCVSSTCVHFEHVPGYLAVCRVFGILAIVVLVGCVSVGIMKCFMDKDWLSVIAATLGITAGCFILIQVAIYARKTKPSFDSSSLILTNVAWVLSLTAGVCFTCSQGKP